MNGTYKVTFEGDYFKIAVKVDAENDAHAIARASGRIEDLYGWDDVRAVSTIGTEVELLDRYGSQRCVSCKTEFAIDNGALCPQCYREAIQGLFDEDER
jgi:hypothetical protein